MNQRLFHHNVTSGDQATAGLVYLKSCGLDTEKHRAAVVASPEYGLKIAYAIQIIKVNAQLTDDNLRRITSYPAFSRQIAESIYYLTIGDINEECHWPILLGNLNKIHFLASDFVVMHRSGILTDENKRYISDIHASLSESDSRTLTDALSFFKVPLSKQMLSQQQFESLCQSPATAIDTACELINSSPMPVIAKTMIK